MEGGIAHIAEGGLIFAMIINVYGQGVTIAIEDTIIGIGLIARTGDSADVGIEAGIHRILSPCLHDLLTECIPVVSIVDGHEVCLLHLLRVEEVEG